MLALAFASFAPLPAWAASATVTLSDPVPTLLDGPEVTSDVNRLATGARPVEGVAADGVSRIVIAVSATNAGQPFTFTIYNDQSAPSASTAENGALAAAGSGQFDHNQLATAAVTTAEGAMAFVIYRAPIDFARPGGADDNKSERSVSIHWHSGTTGSGTIPITILRPPVVLVHGLWSDPSAWENFTPLIGDPRFALFRADYGSLAVSVSSATPTFSGMNTVSAHALGLAFNARYVAPQIDSFVNSFKTGHNPANLSVAAVQADVVAHSMGGIVTRTMPITVGFGSATTFGHGNIQKLITVDTPHLGSPLIGDFISDGNSNPNKCLRGLFGSKGMYALSSVETPAGRKIDGAFGDMLGNGSGDDLSPALQALLPSATKPSLQTPPLPTAFIGAVAGPTQLGGLDTCHATWKDNDRPPQCKIYAVIQIFCGSDPLVKNLTAAGWKNNVMMGPSDALVPLPSEYANHTQVISPLTAIHSKGLELLGLKGPAVLESTSGAAAKAISLLNTWVAKSPTFTGLR